MSEITPTRAAVLEMQDERRAMQEGYQFLDEKRLLLAAEMLRELKQYTAAWQVFAETLHNAGARLREAVARHGLQGVQVYPVAKALTAALEVSQQRLLGVRLQTAQLALDLGAATEPVHPSAEAERCREAYRTAITQAATLAALAGNLERLRHEYRRTERRARALEDVLLPELSATIAELDARLEEVEQEEAIRVRQA